MEAVQQDSNHKERSVLEEAPQEKAAPVFKKKTFKKLDGIEENYPRLDESTVKYYNFTELGDGNGEEIKPYLVYLNVERVHEAEEIRRKKSTAKTIKNIFKIGIIVVAVLCILMIIGLLFNSKSNSTKAQNVKSN